MAKETQEGLTVKKQEDFSEWYNQLVQKAELADYSPVKGCMIIRPYGYAIWQAIQDYFNKRLNINKVKNAYFPLFVPESFFKKEATHAKGFSPEVAWIANKDENTKDRLAIRPTSETVMYDTYSNWVRSWRDLPLRINQWANVVRWETKATKLFIRTREFLWQEGHCVYATEKECEKETQLWLEEYKKLAQDLLAVPVISGKKTELDKFSGADYTLAIESIMPDGKALQMGTSHNLGQSFAKSFDISYLDKGGNSKTPWQNSWGVSTRLIGSIVMTHGDDKGLVLPPEIAPIKGVIIPIFFEDSKSKVISQAKKLYSTLSKKYDIHLDDRETHSPGWKYNEWELKGVPIRIEIGPKDLKNNQVIFVRRDTNEKEAVKIKELEKKFTQTLESIQTNLLKKAKKFLKDSIVEVSSKAELKKAIKDKKVAKMKFCSTATCEELIKEETSSTSRCIANNTKGKCIYCGKDSHEEVYFSKSY
jgi:prolyl-tRNA synthetase